MILQRFDQSRVEGRAAPGRAESPVAQMAARAAGDLAEFGGRQPAMRPVEFPVGREGDVIDDRD